MSHSSFSIKSDPVADSLSPYITDDLSQNTLEII